MKIPMGIDGFFAQWLGKAVDEVARSQQDPLTRSILQWVGHVQMHVMTRWRHVVASGVRCGVRPIVAGRPVQCAEPAIGACAFCGGPVCLVHGAIDVNANIFCHPCVARAAKALGVQPRTEQDVPPPPPRVDQVVAQQRKKFLRVLGLADPITAEELNTTFRELMVKNHPDRMVGATEAKKETAKARCARFTEAYHWLKDHPEARAA